MTSFFRSKAQFYRSYRTLLPCSPVIGNLVEHRPSVHSVSASCIPGKFLDNSQVVVLVVRILYNQEIWRHKLRGAIHSIKIQTGPTGKRGPPQKVDQFFRNFSGWTEPIHWVSDRNSRKLWLNGSRPGSAKNPVSACVCFVDLLYKNLTQTLCSIQIIFIETSSNIDLRQDTWRNPFEVNKERNSRHNHRNQFNRQCHDRYNHHNQTSNTTKPQPPKPIQAALDRNVRLGIFRTGSDHYSGASLTHRSLIKLTDYQTFSLP